MHHTDPIINQGPPKLEFDNPNHKHHKKKQTHGQQADHQQERNKHGQQADYRHEKGSARSSLVQGLKEEEKKYTPSAFRTSDCVSKMYDFQDMS